MEAAASKALRTKASLYPTDLSKFLSGHASLQDWSGFQMDHKAQFAILIPDCMRCQQTIARVVDL